MTTNKLILAQALITVIDTGSFSAAAEKLGTSQSTVSRRIAALESELGGVELFKRGNRWIEPTPGTQTYVNEVRQLLKQFDDADQLINQTTDYPSGTLVISMPPSLGRAVLLPALMKLLDDYSDLNLQIDLSEDYVNFEESTVDIAVRIRPARRTGIQQIKLGQSQLRLVAAPRYIKQFGKPSTLAELDGHQVIGLASLTTSQGAFQSSELLRSTFKTPPKIVVNDVTAGFELVQSGIGVGLFPGFLADAALASGKLVELIPGIPARPFSIYALHPRGLRNTAKISVAITALRASFETE